VAKFVEKGVGVYVRQILTQSGKEIGVVVYIYVKEIVSISSTVLAQCTNVTNRKTERRTKRPQNGITSIAIGEIAAQHAVVFDIIRYY